MQFIQSFLDSFCQCVKIKKTFFLMTVDIDIIEFALSFLAFLTIRSVTVETLSIVTKVKTVSKFNKMIFFFTSDVIL